MNLGIPFFGIFYILFSISLQAQEKPTKQSLPTEFTEKGSSQNIAFRPFKRVIYFGIDEIELNAKAKGILDNLYDFLSKNEQSQVAVTGHSNGSCDSEFCEEIAIKRAEMAAFYLIEKGISLMRIEYNGLGKKKPIANNRTVDGRKKNQRVEIRVFQKK